MMRKSIIMAALLILVLSTGWSVALGSWVSFDGGGNPSPPQIEVLGSDGAQTTVHITVPGMVVEERVVDGQTYQVLRFPDDYATMLNVGEPELPAIRKLVGIPPTCNVSVTVVNQSYTELEGYLVYPFQESLKEGEEPGPFVIDTTLYGTDSFYPQGIAEVGTPTVWRDVRVTRLSLYPVTFNPVTGILRVYDDLTVQLNYSGTDGVNPLVNPPDEVSPSFNQMYRSALINYGYLNLNISDLPLGYLIISPEEYCLSILPLADWKRKKGIPTFIGQVAEGCGTSAVRDTITQYYENYGIEYVLLVGSEDEDDIPPFNYHIDLHGVSQEIYSDFWYSLVDPQEDFGLPDVAIGRLPAHSETDVSTMVNKIFSYERNPDPDWTVKKAIMVADEQDYPRKYSACKRYIGYTIMANSDFDVDTLFGGVSGICNEEVINAFQSSDGLGIVNYFGHGTAGGRSWEEWNRCGFPPGEYFSTTDVDSLENPSRYPVVYNISCWCGSIQEEDWEVLTEAFCNNPNGGASGTLGATAKTWTEANKLFDKELFRAPLDSSIYEIGNIINYAKIKVITVFENDPSEDEDKAWENALSYLWFGDPQMELWTEQPETVAVDHPQEVWPNSNPNVTITVTESGNPLEGALVCLYQHQPYQHQPPEIYLRTLTDAAGQATFSIPPCEDGTHGGSMPVTVTKHNFRPYEGDISVYCPFIRGDVASACGDAQIGMGDGLLILGYYMGDTTLCCLDAGDVDDNGEITMGDGLRCLGCYFGDLEDCPEPPFPDCGLDPTPDDLGCVYHTCCMGGPCPENGERIASGSVKGAPNKLVRRQAVSKDGIMRLPVDLIITEDVLGCAFLVDYDASQLSFTGLVGGKEYDFYRFHVVDEARGLVRVGCIPDLELKEVFAPGEHRVAELEFKVTGLAAKVEFGLDEVEVYNTSFATIPVEWVDWWTAKARAEAEDLPEEFAFRQNYPNPFNPNTLIRYDLPVDCRVRLDVYNVVGQRVTTLVDGNQIAGYKSVSWDGRDENGHQVSSGVYLYRIQAGGFTQVRKMVLLR